MKKKKASKNRTRVRFYSSLNISFTGRLTTKVTRMRQLTFQ